MDLQHCYEILNGEGATPSQEHFSAYWCGMGDGYFRSRVQNPALEVEIRLHDRLARLTGTRRNPRLQGLRDELNLSINQRVEGIHAVA